MSRAACIFCLEIKISKVLIFFLQLYSLLWEQLTGREHLLFYGRLKNLRGSALTEVRIHPYLKMIDRKKFKADLNSSLMIVLFGRSEFIFSISILLPQAVEESLKGVNLYHGGVADKQAGKYSGGMKRRLSVAISLIGDPKVSSFHLIF